MESVPGKNTIDGGRRRKKTHPVALEKSKNFFCVKIAKIYKIFD